MRRRRKHARTTSGLFRSLVSVMLAVAIPFATMPTVVLALPRGGHVTKGSATLSYSTNTLLINQRTSSASFSWTGFNVGPAQSVTYKTPGAASVSMNFIGGTSPAAISGKVVSNGILTFMDANGLVFGQGATVSASGVRAWGSSTPGGSPTGAVTNAGMIAVSPGGTVALVGSSVSNSGTISAPSGEAILAAGSTVTLSSTGSSSLSVAATGGGSVTDSGIISAENLDGSPGTIMLKAGMTSGTTTLTSTALLDASAPKGGSGGSITVDAYRLVLDETAPLDISAPYGKSGTVTIDPSTINTDSAVCLETIDGNGTAANQTSYLGDTITLTGNIDLATGSTLYNWIPLGTSSTSASTFTGTFNGNGHTVCGYAITATNNYGTGFIGYLGSGGKVENLGVTGAVDGGTHCYVGGLVGFNSGTISYSYATGTVSGTGTAVGGLVGVNGNTIQYSYALGNVSGGGGVGGLVGSNYGTISYSYETGTVSGAHYVGGLVGSNYGTISYSYETGAVSYETGAVLGPCYGGGLVGVNYIGTYTADYWDLIANPMLNTIGVGYTTAHVTGVIGLSGAGFGSSSNFSGWTSTNNAGFNTWSSGAFTSPATTDPWFMGSVTYGTGTMSAPMLVPDLATATVTENSGTSVYSGSTVTAGYTTTYTMGGTTLSPNVTVTTAVGPNAGTHMNTPTVSISAPTTQTSVDSVSAVSGTWTIVPATLTATANNASMTYGSSVPTLSGTVTGFVDGQTLASDSGTASWTTSASSASNVGQYGIAGKVTLGSPWSGDYTIVQAPGNSSALAIAATSTNTMGKGSSTTSTSTSGGGSSTTLIPPPIDVLPGAGVPLPFSGPAISQGAPPPTTGSSSGSVSGSGGSTDVLESSPTSSLSDSGGTGSTQGANSSPLSNSSENNIVGVDDTPK